MPVCNILSISALICEEMQPHLELTLIISLDNVPIPELKD